MIEAIRGAGLGAVDCGAVPTPALAMAAMARGHAAVMVTGSHIPADRNGLKFYVPGGEISKRDEGGILAALGRAPGTHQGSYRESDAAAAYLQRSVAGFGPAALDGLRIGVYQHSSVARDLLIEVKGVSVNPVDVKLRAAVQPEDGPRVLGYDAAGVVVEVGAEVTVEVLDVDLDRERVSLSLKATQEDPWRQFARTHAIGQIVPGKVTKLVPFGAFVRVEEGIEGLVHISELAERHVEVPDQVVGVGDDALVKVIDIDLERRRISLSLKQANEDYAEEFDPSKYGMADSYDEGGNYIFPEGFDSETNEWLEGYEKQREEWEGRYAEAERRHKMHTAQMEKTAKDEAAEAANTNYSSESGQASPEAEEGDAPAASAPASTGGSLASDAQLAALREKLSGNA